MSFLDNFSLFFMTVDYVAVQLLQNECPYMIAMVITYVGIRNDYRGWMLYS
jgi:hypothetical protein